MLSIEAKSGTLILLASPKIKGADMKPKQYSNTRICSDHFVSGSPSTLYDEINPDWATPLNLGYESVSIEAKRVSELLTTPFNLGYESVSTHNIETKSERYERAVERSRKRAWNNHEEDPAADVETVESSDYANSILTQIDLSMQCIHEDISK